MTTTRCTHVRRWRSHITGRMYEIRCGNAGPGLCSLDERQHSEHAQPDDTGAPIAADPDSAVYEITLIDGNWRPAESPRSRPQYLRMREQQARLRRPVLR